MSAVTLVFSPLPNYNGLRTELNLQIHDKKSAQDFLSNNKAIVLSRSRSNDRLGIDAVLTTKMEWLVQKVDKSYALGNERLLNFPKFNVRNDQIRSKAFMMGNGGVLLRLLVVIHERTQRLFTGSTIPRRDVFSAGS